MAVALTLSACSVGTAGSGQSAGEPAPAAAGGGPVAAAAPAGATSPDTTTDPAGPSPVTPLAALGAVTAAAASADAASESMLGVVVVDLQTGEREEHHGATQVPPASLYKLFVAATALHLVDLGILTLDEPVGGGACPTVGTAMGYMITVSDNDCARTLAQHLGWNVVESFVRQRGYDDTSFVLSGTGDGGYRVEDLHTSASDVADLLVDLAEGRLLSPASTEHLLGLLEAQYFASPLSEALGPDMVFAHKLGTLDDVSHDAGIVEADGRRYVVVAVTSGWPSGAAVRAEPALTAVGSAVRTYVDGRSG